MNLPYLRACTMNFTSMVEVTVCTSCIYLPTSATLSALTPSFGVMLWMPQACLPWSDHSSQAMWEHANAVASTSCFIHVLARSLCFGVDNASWHLPTCTGWHLQSSLVFASMQDLWPKSLFFSLSLLSPPSDLGWVEELWSSLHEFACTFFTYWIVRCGFISTKECRGGSRIFWKGDR